MKKKLLSLLCACLLLSGCREETVQPTETEPAETQTQAATEELPTEARLPLLEQGIALEEGGNLLYIPNGAVESMFSPEVRLLEHGLLLSEHDGNALVLKRISLEDGALMAEGSVPAGDDAKLSIGNGEIGICDRESGLVSILDEEFRLQRTYEMPREGDEWYLNSEMDTLYVFFRDRGLVARDLESGEELWLVDNGFGVTGKGSTVGYVIFEYMDRADQKAHTMCLNLSTATLETLPVNGMFESGIRQGQTWLLRSGDTHILVENEEVRSFLWEDSDARLLAPRHHLLVTDRSGRNLILYESNGTFLSACALTPNSNAVVGSDFVWSGYWEGYFFTDFIDSSCRLMFWDVGPATGGEDLQLDPMDAALQSRLVVEAQLYERAAQLSHRFGVDIRIAEQCSMDYSHYDTYALTDPVFIRDALDILERAMSRYPEGFFRQLTYGSVESIRIELVGALMLKPDVTTHTDSTGAFAQVRGDYYLIALDGFMMQERIVFHEVSHLIDSRLEWDSLIREDALYSEDAWLALQPEGFHYAMSYVDMPEEVRRYIESDYFVSEYALTYPTEDRATLLAAAMENDYWYFEPGSRKSAKLQFYAECIRDSFDTDGWPEVTAWEQALQ